VGRIMFEEEPIRLETVADGHAGVLFDELLREVLGNISDPNTHKPKEDQPAREINLKFRIKPRINDCGTTLAIEVLGASKLVSKRGAKTFAQVTDQGGVQLAFEATGPARQEEIDNVRNIR